MVVDDQPVFKEAARAVIEATADFAWVGEAASGQQALAVAADVDPDLVLLDVRMPDLDGFETAARLHAAHPRTVVVLISAESPPDHPRGGEDRSLRVRRQAAAGAGRAAATLARPRAGTRPRRRPE